MRIIWRYNILQLEWLLFQKISLPKNTFTIKGIRNCLLLTVILYIGPCGESKNARAHRLVKWFIGAFTVLLKTVQNRNEVVLVTGINHHKGKVRREFIEEEIILTIKVSLYILETFLVTLSQPQQMEIEDRIGRGFGLMEFTYWEK